MMKSAVAIPIYIFELLTSAKSFKDNPIIGSSILNRCGLHVIRVVLAHMIMRIRMWILSTSISKEDRVNFFKHGYIVKENYLKEDDFSTLSEEIKSFKGEVREARQGNTITQRGALSPEVLEDYPAIESFLFDRVFQKLMRFSSGHLRDPLYYVEEVKNQYCEGGKDPQKIFHHDTFHPSMKCWFFIDDIEQNAGAFTYIPDSQRLDWRRIKWEYKMSLTAANHKNTMHARGSTRFEEKDLKELGLPAPVEFSVKQNTLVIVNVFGIHRRGDSNHKSTRLALWGDSRTNPFNPFPGIGGKFVNYWQYYFLSLYRKKADESALKRGARSPWAVVNNPKK